MRMTIGRGTGQTGVVLALGTAQTLAWGSSYYLPAILADPMAEAMGLPRSAVFAMFSAALLLTAALGPASGRAIDLRGGRPVLAVSSLVFALGLLVLGVAPGPVVLTLGWLVLGAAMGFGLYDAAFATLAGLYGRDARNAITGVTLIAGFASTVGWPASALMLEAFGWRGACLGWAVLHIVLGLPMNRFLVPPAPPPAPAGSQPQDGPPPPRFAMPLLAYVFAATAFTAGAMGAHLPGLLLNAGASPSGAILAAALLGPAQVGARILEFGLMRKSHPLIAGRLAAAAHPLAAALLYVVGGPAAPAFALVHGAGNGVLTVVRGTLPLALFGAAGYGLRTGLLAAPARLLQATSPLLFGMALDAFGQGALAITGVAGLLSVVALFLLRVPRPRHGS
jgi:MFS family permease